MTGGVLASKSGPGHRGYGGRAQVSVEACDGYSGMMSSK